MVYDAVHSKVLKRNFFTLIFYEKFPFLRRCIIWGAVGLVLMFFRLYVMNFEGPTFTKIDNAAAYSKNLFSRVSFHNISISLIMVVGFQIFTYNYLYCLNILLLFWPQWLCFDWSMGCIPLVESISDIRIIFVIIFWVFCIYLTIAFVNGVINDKIK